MQGYNLNDRQIIVRSVIAGTLVMCPGVSVCVVKTALSLPALVYEHVCYHIARGYFYCQRML